MSDEIYARMCYDGVPHASLTAYPEIEDRLILLDGWSKTYAMTGWRLGWGVWPRALVEHATRLAINTHSCVNAADAVGRHRRADRAAGRGRRAWSRRSTARREIIVDALERHPGLPLRDARAAPSTPSPTSRAPAGARASCRRSCSNEVGVADHQRHQLRPVWRGLRPLLLCGLERGHRGGLPAHPRPSRSADGSHGRGRSAGAARRADRRD